jgi:hypothetical protein
VNLVPQLIRGRIGELVEALGRKGAVVGVKGQGKNKVEARE